MDSSRRRNAQAVLLSLEADEMSAREGFACMFSSSDEYESALISERRAQGVYHSSHSHWPFLMFICAPLVVAGSMLLLK